MTAVVRLINWWSTMPSWGRLPLSLAGIAAAFFAMTASAVPVAASGGSPGSTRARNASTTSSVAPAAVPRVPANGFYRIINDLSGRCLDVTNGSDADGAPIQIWSCFNPVPGNQDWLILNKGNNTYEVTGVGSGKCLDVTGGGTGDGVQVEQWDCNGGLNQTWLLRPSDSQPFFYQLIALNSGKCLDVTGAATGNGARLQQWTCSNAQPTQQLFEFAPA